MEKVFISLVFLDRDARFYFFKRLKFDEVPGAD